ncbi:MAG: hypothetical protein AAF829_07080 [Pseudomonadota bacterium]
MADGTDMNWTAGNVSECLSLEQAAERLRTGQLQPGTSVDLGEGAVATFAGGDSPEAFLGRLLAHARLIELAARADQCKAPALASVSVDSHAKALLDAIRNAR